MIAQANIAFNKSKGTLRGMHFQFPPAAETKLVRCTRGAILDIIVDLRPESPTYLEHVAVELSEDNDRALYVPERFAHGYQVLGTTPRRATRSASSTRPEAEGGLPVRRSAARPRVAAAGRPRCPTKDAAWAPLARSRTRSSRMALPSAGGGRA